MVRTLWMVLMLCVVVDAAEVLKAKKQYLFVSHDEFKRFRKRESICVVRGEKRLACGYVIKVRRRGVIVKLLERKEPVSVGDRVIRVKKKAALPKQEIEKIELLDSGKSTTDFLYQQLVKETADPIGQDFNLSLGGSIGFNHFYPFLHFQYAISRHFALGLAPLYLYSAFEDVTYQGPGVFATLNYYHRRPYRGLWGHFGLGVYRFSAEVGANEESSNSAAAILTVGWRARWEFGLNLGVAGGVQYLTEPGIGIVEIEFSKFQPTLTFDVGWSF